MSPLGTPALPESAKTPIIREEKKTSKKTGYRIIESWYTMDWNSNSIIGALICGLWPIGGFGDSDSDLPFFSPTCSAPSISISSSPSSSSPSSSRWQSEGVALDSFTDESPHQFHPPKYLLLSSEPSLPSNHCGLRDWQNYSFTAFCADSAFSLSFVVRRVLNSSGLKRIRNTCFPDPM